MNQFCNSCGTENLNGAHFCRKCGRSLTCQLSNTQSQENEISKNKNPGWFKACIFVGVFAVLYGLFAIVTHTSYIASSHYEGNGHSDWVTIVHEDAFGVVRSSGYGYSMEEGTPLSIIEDQAYSNGITSYRTGAFGLIVIGGLVAGGGFLIRKKKKI